ncbi:hypothetical protein [Parabacteroides sp. PF5-9]|uniref:hypothetical protein n=1 Tax=Parabacteroides sp. PF5-9 TaxID=1742404 RepID=UPI0024768FCF|nr:hypothetical protein [Parabacteroides sp. PF5-9]MDH6358011.1 hypothetical protein [Parabacteroides sp. PF5-9]
MNKLSLLSILILMLLVSCETHLSRSVIEPLTVEEIQSVLAEDPSFEETYRTIKLIRDTYLTSELEQAIFADLTYKRLIDYLKLTSDTLKMAQVQDSILIDWEYDYGFYLAKLDSVINYWEGYKRSHSLNKYVEIELERINRDYYPYSREVRKTNLGFRITPISGKVERIVFGYKIVEKGNEEASSLSDYTRCQSSTSFSAPVLRYWEASRADLEILSDKSVEALLSDYTLYVNVEEIKIDGQTMSVNNLQMPESVENYYKYKDRSEFLRKKYAEDLIKEEVYSDYISESLYTLNAYDSYLKQRDPLAYRFLGLLKEEDMLYDLPNL